MKINYKFTINLITVILSQLLIQIYTWHNILLSEHIPPHYIPYIHILIRPGYLYYILVGI